MLLSHNNLSLTIKMNQSNIPIIAIVGRPNVGKSTLFNRIIGKRTAIESKEAGTTRDRLTGEFFWRDQDYLLVDTAGLINPTNEILTESVKAANIAIEQSDLILFIVDFKEGLTEADFKLAKNFRKNKKPVILVVNKCDNKFDDESLNQFKRLGVKNIILVSAISGKNIGDLLDLIYKLIKKTTDKSITNNRESDIFVAIAGRPNVGKSTLTNQLLGETRMIVTKTPNTTRDSQEFILLYKGKNIRIADTAGVNRKSKIDRDTVESFAYLRSLRAIKESQIVIYMLDVEQELTSLDLNTLGQAKELGKSIIIAINKSDLWQNKIEENMLDTISLLQDRLNFMPYVPVVFISAKEKTHLTTLLNQILKVYTERNSTVDQKQIDLIVQKAKRFQAGTDYLKSLRFEKTNPPIFKLTTYKNKKPHFSHLRYLENKTRDVYPFAGTPIFIDWIRE